MGTVKVWNDGTILYAKYETTGGWVMTETHLEVATSLDFYKGLNRDYGCYNCDR